MIGRPYSPQGTPPVNSAPKWWEQIAGWLQDELIKIRNAFWRLQTTKVDKDLALTAGASLSAGDICVLNSSGSMVVADASAAATAKSLLGISLRNLSSSERGDFRLKGVYEASGLTAGDLMYLDTTAGGWTNTAPTGSGEIVRVIGYALSTTEIYFDPDKTWIEV